MAKDTTLSKEERRAVKKAAKSEAAGTSTLEPAGITKSSSSKKDKKEKKEKDSKKAKLAEQLLENGDANVTTSTSTKKAKVSELTGDGKTNRVDKNGEVLSDAEEEEDLTMADGEVTVIVDKKGTARPIGALVPFANPLADDKVAKKMFRGVKKAASQRTLKRGVKEVVKALRKSPTSTAPAPLPVGIVVLAADISPMDVISHIPVLCEDHGIPYIYVTSRAELGMAGQTKRPTSVVMISRDEGTGAGKGKKKEKKGEEGEGEKEEWSETYKGLVKVVEREGGRVKV